MRTLITGAGGFIGSHVVETFLAAGHDVRAMVRYNSRGEVGHLAALTAEQRAKVEIVSGDIADGRFVREAVEGCDSVCHLAALIGIPYSYRAPQSYVNVNIQGTLNVLEACRDARTKRLVVTSTSEVYGTARYAPIDEAHPLQGQSPYSASKIAADKLAEAYHRSFDLPVVTLRPFNTYGPRQSARAVIPTILSQALSGAREIRLGNLSPKRDLTFVADTARAFLLATEAAGIDGETIHFGNGQAISVGELARLCLEVAGADAVIVEDSTRLRPDKSEVELLLCNADKAGELLGWKPQVALREGLTKVADWVGVNLNRFQVGVYSV